MLWKRFALPALALSSILAAPANATAFVVNLSGDTGSISNSQFNFLGLHFNDFFLVLSGLDSSNAIAVAQGDTIHATVQLNNLLTIPASIVRTDLLLYLFGSSFPAENTGVDGTFMLFNGATLVNTFAYGSTTSFQLASFAAVFPPNNIPMTFDSLTVDLTINDLATGATLDGSAFRYSLVSGAAIPEPATWTTAIAGLGAIGAMTRRRRNVKVSFA